MKACAACGRLYPDDAGFCPVDGTALTSATQVPIAADKDDPRVGQLLCERYQIRRVVADGGMGRVYEALDMQERRNVALKILHADVARDEVSVERFKREFEVSRLLPHQHIVEVLGFQPTNDGTYALAMEFLYGEELRATLKREAVIGPARIVRMLAQAALALDAAHAKKFVHRDLKPDNLFLCQTPEGDIVKVLDFGSVKDKGESAKKLTVLGTTIGSPFYMAPEQAQGLDTLDHRADVWALAAIAYECMTSHVPFSGSNGPSILLEILTKDPKSPSEVGKGQKYPVPPTLDPVMAQAFKKMATLRTESVGAFADAVGRAYGLDGSHLEWAAVPEGDIAAKIEAKMPALMSAAPAPKKPADASDSFFGEDDALGAGIAPSPAGDAGVMSAPPASIELAAAGIPKAQPSWLMLAIVGGGAVLLGIVIVLILALR
ncbi:MAG TPA: serine/threonine-protein kinase [Polyangiaceae bacterium]|jgi:serine/threonine-protein kinase|nr:serine/threonine-protein kinase [Polyangiaceae bacterium]